MTARSPTLYLSEILASMDKIERYIAGLSYDEFIRREETVETLHPPAPLIIPTPICTPRKMKDIVIKVPASTT